MRWSYAFATPIAGAGLATERPRLAPYQPPAPVRGPKETPPPALAPLRGPRRPAGAPLQAPGPVDPEWLWRGVLRPGPAAAQAPAVVRSRRQASATPARDTLGPPAGPRALLGW